MISMANHKVAQLQVPGKELIELPLRPGKMGPSVVDIAQLGKHDIFTFDAGFVSTAACESGITYIDGDKGTLLYRGYPINELAKQSDYLEVCYLLYYGELPNETQKKSFVYQIQHHTLVHEQLRNFYNGFPRDAHPMAIMCGVVGALSAFYYDCLKIRNPKDRELAALRLIAKMPTLAAMAYKYSIGQPFIYPKNSLDFIENFFHMMFSVPSEEMAINPVLVRALDRIFILHADHEQNASTSTVRLAGSSGANPYACIAAGIAALWGPAHGGANEAVVRMLEEIGDIAHIEKYILKAKDKDDPFRLMGFGHRIYKNFDPRATVMRETCYEVLDALKIHHDPLFAIALKLEEIALKDSYFIEKKLYPNVDFYSGIILRALGIPINMFTVIFAISRVVGWVSHWNEMLSSTDFKINRPRQLYTGHTQRPFIPLSDRT